MIHKIPSQDPHYRCKNNISFHGFIICGSVPKWLVQSAGQHDYSRQMCELYKYFCCYKQLFLAVNMRLRPNILKHTLHTHYDKLVQLHLSFSGSLQVLQLHRFPSLGQIHIQVHKSEQKIGILKKCSYLENLSILQIKYLDKFSEIMMKPCDIIEIAKNCDIPLTQLSIRTKFEIMPSQIIHWIKVPAKMTNGIFVFGK